MTCIIALKTSKNIVFGADSIISDDNGKCQMRQSKIFPIGDEIAGCCGDLRFIQLLSSNWIMPKKQSGDSVEKYIHISVVDSIRECLAEGGYLEKENDKEKIESELIFSYRKTLYVMDSSFGIFTPKLNYAAIGSGAEIAHGAMFALSKAKTKPEDKIKIALSAASMFGVGIGPPFKLLVK